MFDFLKKSVKEAQEIDAALEACKMEPQEVINKAIDKVYEDEDRWIWVPGYKATNWYMQGYGGYQFEMGKQYDLPLNEEPEMCKRGFHFCPKAKFISRYFNFGRLFKVEVLVKESEWVKAKTWLIENPEGVSYWMWQMSRAAGPDYMKMVGKAVRFIEEIPVAEARQYFNKQTFVHTDEEYEEFCIWTADGKSSDDWNRMKFMGLMTEMGISETLAYLFFMDIPRKSYAESTYEYFKGLIDSGTSRDMAIYLLVQKISEMRIMESKR